MDPVEDVFFLLQADAGVHNILEDKIFMTAAPEGTESPFIILNRVAHRQEYTAEEKIDWQKSVIDVHAVGQTAKQSRQIDQAVRSALDGFAGEGATTHIMAILMGDIEDDFLPVTGDFVATLNMDIFYRSKA